MSFTNDQSYFDNVLQPITTKQQPIYKGTPIKKINEDASDLLKESQYQATNTNAHNRRLSTQNNNIAPLLSKTNAQGNQHKRRNTKKHSFIIHNSNQQTPKSISTSKRTDLVLAYLASSREINDTVVSSNRLLKIIQEEGNLLKDNTLLLNAAGPLQGGRNAKDGVTLFGNNSTLISDYQLNLDNNNNSTYQSLDIYKTCPYIFAIYFQKESGNYFIRSYTGEGCDSRIFFIKLNVDYELVLKRREILSIGTSIFQFTPLDGDNLEINILAMQNMSHTINSNNSDESIEPKRFFSGYNTPQITIGRNEECTYCFKNDKSYSRVQTTIRYEDEHWVIRDGSKEKPSTNGTWVFGLHSFVIKDEMVVEVLNAKLRFVLINNDNGNSSDK